MHPFEPCKTPNKEKMPRQLFIKIRVTPDEKNQFETLALDAGISLSELIRKRLGQFRIRPKEVERERIRQLAKFGNNLNQIARWANVYKHELDAIRVIAELESLRREVVAYTAETERNHRDNQSISSR
ncbi:plasmid mobilization protein [Desulfobulbus elongatus]|uniref:plasmid mobilization protein n=1 Tax=Desulfobulbus elongatus TaxID=53332 RepID=UPI00146F9D41|nr:plasmid mobilization relaxosome protein MobC [Desulfobulbus elongatus]